MKHYDVVLVNKKLNSRTSYFADSFCLGLDGILHIASLQFGSCCIQISPDEELIIRDFIIEDEV